MIITELKLNKVGWKGSGVSLSIRVTLHCLSCSVRLGADGYNDDVYVDPVFLYWFPKLNREQILSGLCTHVLIACTYEDDIQHHDKKHQVISFDCSLNQRYMQINKLVHYCWGSWVKSVVGLF